MDEILLEVIWNKKDIAKALEENGHTPSEENIERILSMPNLLSFMEDESISRGWEIIHTAVHEVFSAK